MKCGARDLQLHCRRLHRQAAPSAFSRQRLTKRGRGGLRLVAKEGDDVRVVAILGFEAAIFPRHDRGGANADQLPRLALGDGEFSSPQQQACGKVIILTSYEFGFGGYQARRRVRQPMAPDPCQCGSSSGAI